MSVLCTESVVKCYLRDLDDFMVRCWLEPLEVTMVIHPYIEWSAWVWAVSSSGGWAPGCRP